LSPTCASSAKPSWPRCNLHKRCRHPDWRTSQPPGPLRVCTAKSGAIPR
jgi:hypothetical protein